ncbi:transcriptional regulator [Amycolatopsis saalfeldensis]|uniref:DNA-binding transcriptional regulator, MarR family n=1 Tax=Amycolatopsis saalfeldensis TaxID=394193 RepID=A0A1H8Y493_9PSEU|nr:transcriptional regulator [Amycolatopsis saalfeldensis]SEP46368.1 DNA-binding transcriptional regulator, MarR family [Amycolatopsis saalfeldensis]
MVERELESGLREVVHQRVRLGVLAVLDRRGPCTFSQLRDALGQSDGGLGRHLGVLEEHGYIATEKVFENRRPRTWIRMTEAGAEAFREEQELLAKLLATASPGAGGEGEDHTAAMTIVFAALLAGEDAEPASPGRADRSVLVPGTPVLGGRRRDPVNSGPISARYDFPPGYAVFGSEQDAQRLMMRSHGLRGGWVTTWSVDDREPGGPEQAGAGLAHALVFELAGASDCAAILAVMGSPTVPLPDVPEARGYLVPGAGDGAPATAVAWFSDGPHLASVVIVAEAAVAVAALETLVSEVHRSLAAHRN